MGGFFRRLKEGRNQAILNRSLCEAAERGDTAEVESLVDQGADPEARKDNFTALMLAAEGGHVETVRALEAKDAKLNPNVLWEWDSFSMAVMSGNAGLVSYFLERGANPNTSDPEHSITALMSAAENGYTEIVKVLLDHGAKTDPIDWMDRTVFDYAEGSPPIEAMLRR